MNIETAKEIGALARTLEYRRALLASLEKPDCELAIRAGSTWGGGREVIVTDDDPEKPILAASFQRALIADIGRLESKLGALGVNPSQNNDRSA